MPYHGAKSANGRNGHIDILCVKDSCVYECHFMGNCAVRPNRKNSSTVANETPEISYTMASGTPEIVEKWRKLIKDAKKKNWVVFENGTIVIVEESTSDNNIQSQAVEILKRDGPVFPGSETADFNVLKPTNDNGWIVIGWKPYILNYVSPSECTGPSDLFIGLAGRQKRAKDTESLRVIHVNTAIGDDDTAN